MSARIRVFSGALAALLVAGAAAAQPIALVGGTVHPVSGPPIENGTVVMDQGRITAVGAAITPPAGAQVPRAVTGAPDVAGGPWINSAPLTLPALRGRVVLVEFWTYG